MEKIKVILATVNGFYFYYNTLNNTFDLEEEADLYSGDYSVNKMLSSVKSIAKKEFKTSNFKLELVEINLPNDYD